VNIERDHARKIHDTVRPYASYLVRLKERMEKVGFPLTDTLYQMVLKAQTAAQSLTMDLHYRSCAGGVGRATED
jgi:phosphoribosylpyrophosphate synthetase